MTDDVRMLAGGYATGTLTPEERERLFRAALEDSALFEALADEEALRDLLEDSAARARLLEATEHRHFSMRGIFQEWLSRPKSRVLVGIGLVALAAIGIRALWERSASMFVPARSEHRIAPIIAPPVGPATQPETAFSSGSPPLEVKILRQAPSGETQIAPQNYGFAPDDRFGMALRPARRGLLQVQNESGKILYSGVTMPGEVVTLSPDIPFGDVPARSLRVRFIPRPEQAHAIRTQLRAGSPEESQATEGAPAVIAPPATEMSLEITLKRKSPDEH